MLSSVRHEQTSSTIFVCGECLQCHHANASASILTHAISSINKFKDGETGRKGWAGFAGCGAVAVSENGLLLAAADGGGTVVIFRKYPEWEVPSEHDGSDSEQAPSAPGGMAFSPTSSYAGSVAADSFSPDNSGYQEVARLRHSHRVRSLTWATEPGWPVLGAGSADGRVRLWRPMGEGQVEVNVSGLRLQNVKPGKEDIYAVVSVGRKIRIGAEVVMDWTVNFPREEDSAFELMNSRQVINVVLYVRPKQKKQAGLERRDSLDSKANKKQEGDGFSRAGSLDTGGESGEGAMAKLIKKKEVLVGKGSAPRMFDRVTMAEDYTKVAAAAGVDLREVLWRCILVVAEQLLRRTHCSRVHGVKQHFAAPRGQYFVKLAPFPV